MKQFVITVKANMKRREIVSEKNVYWTIEEAEAILSAIKEHTSPDNINQIFGEGAYDSLKVVEVEDFDVDKVYDFGTIDIYILDDRDSPKWLLVMSADRELFEIIMRERKARMRSPISSFSREYCYEVERLDGENNRDFVNWLVGVLPKEKEFAIFV
jgi:hypothetical protein